MSKYHLAPSEDGIADSLLERGMVEEKDRSRSSLKMKKPFLVVAAVASIIYCLGTLMDTKAHKKYALLPRDATFPFHYGSQDVKFLPKTLNSTLGFGKIYILNLPARLDKRFEMTILAEQYGLSVEFVDGVDGRLTHPQKSGDYQGKSGVADAHANAWKRLLDSGYETALIFEDDVDFDVRLREELSLLQGPLATYLSMVNGQNKVLQLDPEDPWNHKSWDLLWLGNSKDKGEPGSPKLAPGEPIPYLTYVDTTVTGRKGDRDYVRNTFDGYALRKNSSEQNLRVIKKPYDIWGLQGYALSRSGALRCLYKHAHDMKYVNHIDWKVANLIYSERIRGYTVLPPLFSQFRRPNGSKDSDRVHETGSLPSENGISLGIAQSAKQRLAQDLGMAKYREVIPSPKEFAEEEQTSQHEAIEQPIQDELSLEGQ